MSVLYLMTDRLKDYGKIYFKIGSLLMDKQNFEKALLYFNEAYNYIPEDIELIIKISENYRLQEKYKESLGALSKAFKSFPNHHLIFYYAHLVYEEIGDDHTAIEMLKNCLAVNQNFSVAYNSLGNILKKIKKYENAIIVYQTGINLFPDNEDLVNNLANCELEKVKMAHYKGE